MSEPDKLEDAIFVAIRTAPKTIRNGVAGKNAIEADKATALLARLITDAVRRHYDQSPAVAPSTPGPKP